MTRDQAIRAAKAEIGQLHAARGGKRMIMRAVQIDEISMVDAPAGKTFATAIVYPNSNRVEPLGDKPAESLFGFLQREFGITGWRPLQ